MKVIVFEEIEEISKEDTSLFYLVGRTFQKEDLIHVFKLKNINQNIKSLNLQKPFKNLKVELVGICTFEEKSLECILSEAKEKLEPIENGFIVCNFSKENPTGFFIRPDIKSKPVDIVLLSQQRNKFSRIEKILNSKLLGEKKITIVGLGSGGSRVAVELAKCGVGSEYLIDFDRLEEHNIIRHVCGRLDVGRFKTHAVRELLELFNPSIKIETFEIDIRNKIDEFKKIVQKSDLVIAATGVPQTNHLINGICVQENVDAVYAGVYEKGSGGFVMRVIPHKTPCYDCVYDVILKTSPPVHLTDEQRARYSTIEDASELKAEPGISIDIGFICLLQAKMALLTLLRDEETELEDIPHNFLLWFNRSYGPFRAMSLKKVRTKRRKKCATCQKEIWEEEMIKNFGLEISKADELAEEILEEIENGRKGK